MRLEISGGQVHDSQMMDGFLDWNKEPLAIVADKAYGSTKIRRQIADEGALAVIPSKSNARRPIPHDPNLYARRNIVERFFCRMKDMRRLATRFEKTATNFRSMLYLFAARCWCNWVHTLALLWQIYSRRRALQIHFRQCGHRCGGSRAMSSRMAWRTAGKVG